jgi:hypothetical protein
MDVNENIHLHLRVKSIYMHSRDWYIKNHRHNIGGEVGLWCLIKECLRNTLFNQGRVKSTWFSIKESGCKELAQVFPNLVHGGQHTSNGCSIGGYGIWESISYLGKLDIIFIVCNLYQQSICVKCFKNFWEIVAQWTTKLGRKVINWMKKF